MGKPQEDPPPNTRHLSSKKQVQLKNSKNNTTQKSETDDMTRRDDPVSDEEKDDVPTEATEAKWGDRDDESNGEWQEVITNKQKRLNRLRQIKRDKTAAETSPKKDDKNEHHRTYKPPTYMDKVNKKLNKNQQSECTIYRA